MQMAHLYITGQKNSYPNIMAQQFAFAGGGDFTQPLMNDNLRWFIVETEPKLLKTDLYWLLDANGNPGPVRFEGTPTTDIANQINRTIQ